LEAVVLTRYGSPARSCRERLLLHARKQLLLPLPSLQSNSSHRNQKTRKRDEGKCSSNSSIGLTKTSGLCPGAVLTIRITFGFPRSCYSRLKLRRHCRITSGSFKGFHRSST